MTDPHRANGGYNLSYILYAIAESVCRRLVVVLVHRGRAEGSSADVLLDRRLGPATERREVREGRIVVVVGVPQGQAAELRRAAHNGVPLAGAGVDAQRDASLLALVHHALQEVDVVGGRGRPVLGALHVQPQHAVLGAVVGKVVDGVVHLIR